MAQGRARRSGAGPTTRAIAALAGTSAMTVCNVLNGTGKVGEATRRRVERAIAASGYSGQAAARRPAGADPRCLGLLYTRPDSAYVGAALAGAMAGAAREGVRVIARDCDASVVAQPESAMQALVADGAAGLLLLPPIAELASGGGLRSALNVPVATISTGDALPGISTVRIDEQAAAAAMTELLLDHGHRRIGLVTGPATHSGSLARRRGFEKALAERGLPASADLVVGGDYDFESGVHAADRLLGLQVRPTAIFACNDEMAAGVFWTAQRLGCSIPDELAIAGFDDSPLAKRLFPPLTAVRQPVAAMAERAVALLIAAMRDDARGHVQDVLHAHSLIQRASTDASLSGVYG